MKDTLEQFKTDFALSVFGLTLEDALSKNICIRCKTPVDNSDWEPIDIDEYLISGLCPSCYDEISLPD